MWKIHIELEESAELVESVLTFYVSKVRRAAIGNTQQILYILFGRWPVPRSVGVRGRNPLGCA